MSNKQPVIDVGILAQLSIAIVVAILAPLLAGIWIDRTFHTGPIILLILVVIGLTLGSAAVYRIVKDAYARFGGGKQG